MKSLKITPPEGFEIDREKSTFDEIVFKPIIEWVDFKLPSGTLWAKTNQKEYYNFDEAKEKFGKNLPTEKQWKELIENTSQIFQDGKLLIYRNGFNEKPALILPAAGYRNGTDVINVGSSGYYWSSTPGEYYEHSAWRFYFNERDAYMSHNYRSGGRSVRLVNNNTLL